MESRIDNNLSPTASPLKQWYGLHGLWAALALPLLLLVCLVAGDAAMYWSHVHKDDAVMAGRTEAAARHWGRSCEDSIQGQILSLVRLQRQLEAGDAHPSDFAVLAAFACDPEQCPFIARVDALGRCLDVYPPDARKQVEDALAAGPWRDSLEQAAARRVNLLTDPMPLGGAAVVLCIVPASGVGGLSATPANSLVIAEFRLGDVFRRFLSALSKDFHVELRDGQGRIIYASADVGQLLAYRQTTVIAAGNQHWELSLSPSAAHRSQSRGVSYGPYILAAGLVLALLSSAAVFSMLYQRWRQIQQSLAQLEAVRKIDRFSVAANAEIGSSGRILQRLMQAACDLLNMDGAAILRVDMTKDLLEVVAVYGKVPQQYETRYALKDTPLCRRVITEGTSYFNGDLLEQRRRLGVWTSINGQILTEFDKQANQHIAHVYNAAALIVAPLIARGRPWGVIIVGSLASRRLSAVDRRFLDILCAHGAVTIVNSDLYEQNRRDVEAKAILLRELNHRVKNNLASVVSLLSIGRPRLTTEAAKWLDGATARIGTLARAHNLFSGYLERIAFKELLDQVIAPLSALAPPRVTIRVDVDRGDINLRTGRAVALAMILNELCSNALSHGTVEGGEVVVRVRYLVECKNDQDEMVRIEVIDQGRSTAEVSSAPSHHLGLALVQGLVANEMRGRFWLQLSARGATATIEFPLVGDEMDDHDIHVDAAVAAADSIVAGDLVGKSASQLTPAAGE